MLLITITKNLSPPRLRQLCRILTSQKRELLTTYHTYSKTKILSVSLAPQLSAERCYSVNPQQVPNLENLLKPLSNDEPIIVPSVFKGFRTVFNLHGQLRRLDTSFDLLEFTEASRHAVDVVSHHLSRENYEALEELVTSDVILKLRQKICTLSAAQKELIAIKEPEIYAQFPYTIELLYDGQGDNQRTYAEITMVYYTMRGLKELRERNLEPPLQMGMMPEYADKIFIANYRFRRDYTSGNDGPWIINLCNQFNLLALQN